MVVSSPYWIGLHKFGEQWIWEDGSPFLFANWRSNQPDNCCGADVTCTIVNYRANNGQWDDAGCVNVWKNPTSFVCKKSFYNMQ